MMKGHVSLKWGINQSELYGRMPEGTSGIFVDHKILERHIIYFSIGERTENSA